jgi:uncharacterized membrane-anchored protein YitT (DUF2179 family)
MGKNRVHYCLGFSRLEEVPLYVRGFFIFCGAALVAFSLEFFLVKNYVIDGSLVGVAILLSHIYKLDIGLILLILNTPFLIIGHFYLGPRFFLLSLYTSIVLSIGTNFFAPFPVLTTNPFAVILIGGGLLGLGVGIIIRFGGFLDETEIMAILLSEQSRLSIWSICFDI